jgi:catalase
MEDRDRANLVTNVADHAAQGPGLDPDVADRVAKYFGQIDPELGSAVATALRPG